MTVAANPLSRLAPRTRLQTCAHLIQQRFKATLTGLPQRRIEDILRNCSTASSTSGHDDGLQDDLLNQEMPFNIHNPSLDHRAR
ncbi:MAG: hypothetical protein ACLPND_14015 [Candidatus Korobacteraceae bacterium]|jgi:hypothetical protein